MSLQSKIFAALLSLFLLFNGTIQHLVHHFEDHTDTVHQHCSDHQKVKGGFSFESQHHHCDYLTSLLPHFIGGTPIFQLEVTVFPSLSEFRIPEINMVSLLRSGPHFLRGPPTFSIA